MKVVTRVALTLCCLLLAAGCRPQTDTARQDSASAAQPPAASTESGEPKRQRIVFLGDSLTAGYGLLESQSYPTLIQQKIDRDGYKFEIVNAGVSGDTSAGALRRLDWALEGDARVLVVALGGNDGLRGLSVAEMKNNITSIIEKARERNLVVILAGMEAPPNYGQEYSASFRAAFQDVARSQRVLFIPFLLSKVAGQPALNLPDGIHPNPQGAEIVAETVWAVLQPVLDQMLANQ